MVNHDHDRVEVTDGGEVCNEVHEEVQKWARSFEDERGDSGDGEMGEYLVCLANHTAGDKFPDVGGKA